MVVLTHAIKAHRGTVGIAPLIFHVGARYSQVISLMPQLLYIQENRPWYPLERKQGGPQSSSPLLQKGYNCKNKFLTV
jgi:hypothetical protein